MGIEEEHNFDKKMTDSVRGCIFTMRAVGNTFEIYEFEPAMLNYSITIPEMKEVLTPLNRILISRFYYAAAFVFINFGFILVGLAYVFPPIISVLPLPIFFSSRLLMVLYIPSMIFIYLSVFVKIYKRLENNAEVALNKVLQTKLHDAGFHGQSIHQRIFCISKNGLLKMMQSYSCLLYTSPSPRDS
eukprot:TRINITY_DN3702_c0_g4_i4.p1 TRINITY_DN3702_c0_g4~~TRINITY_DN3702_c0_g4_i4.p1  ORF type:complete len:187 (-),score=14.99 TRINITY_DN3702_c0_g4_i4:57-617(-)